MRKRHLSGVIEGLSAEDRGLPDWDRDFTAILWRRCIGRLRRVLSDKSSQIVGAVLGLALFVETVEGIDVGFDSEPVRRRLGDAFENDIVGVSRQPIKQVSLLFVGQFRESAILTHANKTF
jgi:hypothetical protein